MAKQNEKRQKMFTRKMIVGIVMLVLVPIGGVAWVSVFEAEYIPGEILVSFKPKVSRRGGIFFEQFGGFRPRRMVKDSTMRTLILIREDKNHITTNLRTPAFTSRTQGNTKTTQTTTQRSSLSSSPGGIFLIPRPEGPQYRRNYRSQPDTSKRRSRLFKIYQRKLRRRYIDNYYLLQEIPAHEHSFKR